MTAAAWDLTALLNAADPRAPLPERLVVRGIDRRHRRAQSRRQLLARFQGGAAFTRHRGARQRAIYAAIRRRLWRAPLSFLWPPPDRDRDQDRPDSSGV